MKNLIKIQHDFDKDHGWDWTAPKNELEKLKHLQFCTIAITGEIGEFSNKLKKILREHDRYGKVDPNMYTKLREELPDILIYLIKIADLLGIDLEQEFVKKTEVNKERFKKFSKI